jgi:hypothetical protein
MPDADTGAAPSPVSVCWLVVGSSEGSAAPTLNRAAANSDQQGQHQQ